MTQRQNNALNMYNAVLQYLDENFEIWHNVTPVANQRAHLKSIVDSINGKSEEQQGKSTTGYTASKIVAMDTMVSLAYKMALKIKGYAKKTGNKVILQSVDFSISRLQSGSSREVINRCKIIAATAQAIATRRSKRSPPPCSGRCASRPWLRIRCQRRVDPRTIRARSACRS